MANKRQNRLSLPSSYSEILAKYSKKTKHPGDMFIPRDISDMQANSEFFRLPQRIEGELSKQKSLLRKCKSRRKRRISQRKRKSNALSTSTGFEIRNEDEKIKEDPCVIKEVDLSVFQPVKAKTKSKTQSKWKNASKKMMFLNRIKRHHLKKSGSLASLRQNKERNRLNSILSGAGHYSIKLKFEDH